MVSTRKSLFSSPPPPESTAPEDLIPASTERQRKLKSAIKKLEINALGPLKGEKPLEQTLETYHYRGAVYAQVAGTKPEWVDQQPDRYKKRKSDAVAQDDHAVAGARESGSEPRRKRTRMSTENVTVASKKRARMSTATNGERSAERPAKRSRRDSAGYDVSHARSRNAEDSTPSRRRTRESEQQQDASPGTAIDQLRTSRHDDSRTVGGKNDVAEMKKAKKRAAARGYNTKPFTESEIANSTALERTVGQTLLKLAKLNTQIDRMREKLNRTQANLHQYPELEEYLVRETADFEHLTPGGKAHGGTEVDTIAGAEDEAIMSEPQGTHPRVRSQSPPDPASSEAQREPAPATQPQPSNDAAQQFTSFSQDSDVEIITERHDSAASITAASPATRAPPAIRTNRVTHPSSWYRTTPASEPRPAPEGELPPLNKAAHPLRWSLPKQISELGRAEHAINMDQMEGESKGARRRRIKRELKMVKEWKVVGMGGEDEERTDADGGGDTIAAADRDVQDLRTPTLATGAQLNEQDATSPTDSVAQASSDSDERRNSTGSGGRKSARQEQCKNVICHEWQGGFCRRGERCTYRHSMV